MALDGRRVIALLAMVGGLLGSGLALSPTIGAIAVAPSADVLYTLGHARAKTPSLPRLQAAVAAREAGLSWYATASGWAELAALHVAIARDRLLAPRVRAAHYDHAVTAARSALMLSPVLPYAWAHYAYAVLARDVGAARIDAPLIMSMNTALRDPALVRLRIEIGFVADRLLAPETREAVKAQVVMAARGDVNALARFAHRDRALGWIRAALADEPDLQRKFDTAYLRASRIR